MDQLPDARIAFIGDGPYRGELEEIFKVVPSESETLALVVLEAMSSGLPVVTSRAGGFVDIIPEDQEGKTDFCFNPAEVEDCVKKEKALLDDKELRENMGLAAREEVGKYDWRADTKKIRNEQYNVAIWFWRKKRAEFFRPFQWLFRRSHRSPRISY